MIKIFIDRTSILYMCMHDSVHISQFGIDFITVILNKYYNKNHIYL